MGVDEAAVRYSVGELPAKAFDVDVDRAITGPEGGFPDSLIELAARNDPPGATRKREEEPELVPSEI